jgi:hypothetical protein
MGKPYTTSQMEKTIKRALEYGCDKFDIFFMVGLPAQTAQSALDSIEYSKRLYERLGHAKRIYTFIAPMAPFLDPGSMIFEDPERYGYTQLYKTLREHKEALYKPSWKLYLNYQTDWMTRDEITEITYEAMIRMNVIKAEYGVTDQREASKVSIGLNLARDIMRRIDTIVASTPDDVERSELYHELRREIERTKNATGLAKKELRMPGGARIRVKGALKYLLNFLRGNSRNK